VARGSTIVNTLCATLYRLDRRAVRLPTSRDDPVRPEAAVVSLNENQRRCSIFTNCQYCR
jgi:hypothetical protein